MTDLSRRSFLQRSASLACVRKAVGVAAVTPTALLPTTPAQAWIGAALGVAATVAGMVAAHNRGDGGIGAILAATQERLRLIIEKLAEIQTSIADVMEELRKFPAEVEMALRRDDVRRLQRERQAVLSEYVTLLKTRERFTSDLQWKSENVREDLRRLLGRLEAARGNLRTDPALDPTTAIVVSSVALLEHSLLVLLDYRSVEIGVRLETTYLPWFDDMLNPRFASSAIGYASAAAERHVERTKAAAETALGKALGMRDNTILNACVGVNDFTPADPGKRECQDLHSPVVSISPGETDIASLERKFAEEHGLLPDEAKEVASAMLTTNFAAANVAGASRRNTLQSTMAQAQSDASQPQTIILVRQSCWWTRPPSPERASVQDRLFQNVKLLETELVAVGKPTGIRVLNLSMEPEVRFEPGQRQPAFPADASCQIEKRDMKDGNVRLNHMRQIARWQEGLKNFKELERLVTDINTQRTKYAYGIAATGIAQTARAQLIDILKRYSA